MAIINLALITLLVVITIILIFLALNYAMRSSHKTKINNTTVFLKPQKLLAKLIFSKDKVLKINKYQKTIGRDDFLGFLTGDDLLFIGKKHFMLTRLDDGFYIEDLNSKNGTKVNSRDIRGLGKIKLKNNDEITISDFLKLKYLEETY
jgi:pSer/pThr/pTyr-binding forkhead associated (FHA) protein